MAEKSTKIIELTEAQKSRMERNRARAVCLRQSAKARDGRNDNQIIKVKGHKYIDGGGGFLLEDSDFPAPPQKQSKTTETGEEQKESSTAKVQDDAVAIPITYEECIECGDPFADSYLFNNFSHSVCDKCRDPDDRHSLITRTEAKAEYLLKDCDFDQREPPLRFISRKNPHNVRWGVMKLYLHSQVEKRAMEVWGTEEELMKQHENRDEKREVTKIRKYNKKMKQLRMEVRSSLFTKETKGPHVHTYGEDTYNEEEDTYTHTCTVCSFTETYEKM